MWVWCVVDWFTHPENVVIMLDADAVGVLDEQGSKQRDGVIGCTQRKDRVCDSKVYFGQPESADIQNLPLLWSAGCPSSTAAGTAAGSPSSLSGGSRTRRASRSSPSTSTASATWGLGPGIARGAGAPRGEAARGRRGGPSRGASSAAARGRSTSLSQHTATGTTCHHKGRQQGVRTGPPGLPAVQVRTRPSRHGEACRKSNSLPWE